MQNKIKYGSVVHVTNLKANKYFVTRVDNKGNVYGTLVMADGILDWRNKGQFLGHVEEMIVSA